MKDRVSNSDCIASDSWMNKYCIEKGAEEVAVAPANPFLSDSRPTDFTAALWAVLKSLAPALHPNKFLFWWLVLLTAP